jgi:hypothetical protein
MKATLALNGKAKDVHAIVGLALETGVLVSFIAEADGNGTSTGVVHASRGSDVPDKPREVGPRPFVAGDRVSKKYNTEKSKVPRFSCGTVVRDARKMRGGWQVDVHWDDPALQDSDGFIMASALRKESK